VDFVFDDDDTSVVRLVDDQIVGGAEFDAVAVADELGHQIGAPADDPRPTGEVVEDLVDDVVGDDVEDSPSTRSPSAPRTRSK
jgi:hypothetical protein